jgi:exodeoxyribonuclease-1
MKKTYLWYDYETFGADPKRDRISQFAGIRTDMNFKKIDEMVYYCKLEKDYLPNPEASLITGITPQEANEKGITENQLAEILFREFTREGTITVGYNSIKFDDEVTRNLFYRTFRDPYEREWKNNCSRWDFMRAVLGVYVMKPELINWPLKEDGKPSFRLEELSVANGIIHEKAHDATSDVYATIGLAELLNKKAPGIFKYFLDLRNKEFVKSELAKGKLFLHIDFGYGYEKGYVSLLYKVGDFAKNGDKNSFLFIDLLSNIDILENMSVSDMKEYIYYTNDKLVEIGIERPGLKQIRINQSPILISYSSLKDKPDFLNVILENLDELLARIENLIFKRKNDFFEIFHRDESVQETDVDLDIYGAFPSPNDKREMSLLHEKTYEYTPKFKNAKYKELYFRFLGRNMPELLTKKNIEKWESHCYESISKDREGFQNLNSIKNQLMELRDRYKSDVIKLKIIEDLENYTNDLEEILKPKAPEPGKQLKIF